MYTITVAKHQEKGGLFVDIAVTQGLPICILPATTQQALLVWGDALQDLDHGLDIIDGVRSIHFKSDGLASVTEGLDDEDDEDVHIITVARHQVKGGLFLDVVVTQGTPIFKQYATIDQVLLVWGDTLLVLDLGLDIFDGVISFHFKSDGLASEGLHKDPHTTM